MQIRKIILIGLLVFLMASSGCVVGKPEPADTAPPVTRAPTTFSQELLKEQISLLLMGMAYERDAAKSIASEVVGWEDEDGNSLIGRWKGELIDTKLGFDDGDITINELTDKEIWIALELSRKIKEEIPTYGVENWNLEKVFRENEANCQGYTQLFFVLGKTAGLGIEPIEVIESDDIREARITAIINLSDSRVAMAELTSATAYVSQPFALEEVYKAQGNYLQIRDREGSKLPHFGIRLLDSDGLMASIFISRAINFETLNEHARAISENAVAIDLDPGYALAYNNRGASYRSLGYSTDALADFNKAIMLNPALTDAYSNRGVVYTDTGDYQRAVYDLESAILMGDESATVYYNRGVAYDRLEDPSKAASDFTTAIERNPGYTKAYFGRGDAYADLEQYSLAISDYARAIELDQDFSEAYSNRGTAHAKLEDYELAASDYTKAIELTGDNAVTYYNRGNVYTNLKEYELALSDYTRAIEIDINFAEAYNNRGNTYAKMGFSGQAQQDFDKAALLDPRFER